MNLFRPVIVVGLLAVICASIGCGANHVSGRVTVNGSPLAGASLMFHPQFSEGAMCQAVSDDEGLFSLATVSGNRSITPGTYAVTVIKEDRTQVSPPSRSPAPGQADDLFEENQIRRGEVVIAASSAVQSIYSDPKTTPLKVVVPPGGDQNLKIELQKGG